jgi:hypothetical protein
MQTYRINGTSIDFDDTLEYSDFFLEAGKPKAVRIDWTFILSGLQDGSIPWDKTAIDEVRLLSRWINEAPRKRFYRDMIRQGVTVASAEYFFEADGGDKFIDALENSGKIAIKVLAAYGVEGVKPINHTDPIAPTPTADILAN